MYCNFTGELLMRVLPPLLLTEFVLGVLGNGLALWIFCFHLKSWNRSTVFLFNLALADFLLNVALPFRASYYHSGIKWNFGDTFCNVSLFMLAMNRSGSIFFLMAVAVDRYMRVVHPHHPINSLSISKAACGAVGLWVVTISMTAHLLTIPRGNTTQCESFGIDMEPNPRLTLHKSMFVFSFYLPLVVILYCTARIIGQLRGRQLIKHAKIKRALCFITVVVVLFVICFLPSNIIQLLIWFKAQQRASNKTLTDSALCDALKDLDTAFYITISLTYLNTILDPVVYYFSSPAFNSICRRAFGLGQVKKAGDNGKRKTRDTGSQSISPL